MISSADRAERPQTPARQSAWSSTRTEIWFELPGETPAKLSVYNAHGALVRVLVNGVFPAGRHRAVWTGRNGWGVDSATGVYFYRLESNFGAQTRKMVLLK